MAKKIIDVLLLGIFLVSSILCVSEFLQKRKAEEEYSALQESMWFYETEETTTKAQEEAMQATKPVISQTETNPAQTETESSSYQPSDFLSELMQENHSVIGWLKIGNTNVDYPIVQNKEDNEWFLHRDINGKKSYPGSIYMDSNHRIEEPGLHVIYGHHMKNGTMFKDIVKFKDPEYFDAHQDITVSTGERMINLKPLYCYAGESDGSYRNVISSKEDLKTFLYEKTGQEFAVETIYVFITCSYESADSRTYLITREE